MVDHHYSFRARKGVFHGGKPPAQRRQFPLGKFVLGWRSIKRRVCKRRNAPHRQRKRHNFGLLGHFVPFAPDTRAAPAAVAVPKPHACMRGRLWRPSPMPRCGTRERRPFANYLSIADRYSAQPEFILRILSAVDAKSIEPKAEAGLFCQPCRMGNSGRKATVC